jgi:hypothetical protein
MTVRIESTIVVDEFDLLIRYLNTKDRTPWSCRRCRRRDSKKDPDRAP